MRERLADECGATLIELVVVMVVTGILAGVVGSFLSKPMLAFSDARTRAALVDVAESSLRRMERDVRASLPNSVRVAASGPTLELFHGVDGARYRAAPGTNPSAQVHTGASDWLNLSAATGDASFNVLGRLEHLAFTYGAFFNDTATTEIYTTSPALLYAHAEAGTSPGVITPSSTQITVIDDGDEDQISLSSPHRFLLSSPGRRVYLSDGPVTYRCDTAAGTLVRYAGYGPTATQPTNPLAAPLSGGSAALVAEELHSCAIQYEPGTPERAGTMRIALGFERSGEAVTLMQQIHVENTP
jgi:MSHA biogenesis protein MshO